MHNNKANRRNEQQQRRDAKRQELMRRKRNATVVSALPPPRVVGIVSLGANLDVEERLSKCIASVADKVVQTEASVHCKYIVHKKDGQLTVLTSHSSTIPAYQSDTSLGDDTRAVLAALDLARVCDVLLFVIDGNGPKPDERISEIQIGAPSGKSSVKTASSSGPDYDHLISARGDRILTALKAQGLPTPLTVLARTTKEWDEEDDQDYMTTQSVKSMRRATVKRRLELKKYICRFATTEFGTGNDRVVDVDLSTIDDADDEAAGSAESTSKAAASAAALVRTLCSMSCHPPKWVSQSPRSYLLADACRYEESTQELHLTGHIRGLAPWNCNALVHMPNIGTFAAKSLGKCPIAPLSRPFEPSKGSGMELDAANDSSDALGEVLLTDPGRQESLDMFASPDALTGEQNLVGFDDGEDMGPQDVEEGEAMPRPAGWSDYQAAWMDAVDPDQEALEHEEQDRGEMARELNERPAFRSDLTLATGMTGMDVDEANDVTMEDKRAIMEQRRKEQRENQEFPDEVQVAEDQKASERFARYRSLKSFRKSYWDPKENLPESYASIYHFSNFKATQRSILNEQRDRIRAAEQAGSFWGCTPPQDTDGAAPMYQDDLSDKQGSLGVEVTDGRSSNHDDDASESDRDLLWGCVPTGAYVTLTLRGVPPTAAAFATGALVVAVSLLPHENKMSVVHMAISRQSDTDPSTSGESFPSPSPPPVKSKDPITFRCGWRTWEGRPVYSQWNPNGAVHPLERFLPPHGVASAFGPVTFGTTTPVLCFSGDRLVASGSVTGSDAGRVILKRAVLTGYPVRVQKRRAVVKYMFYNPDDVRWFQPAGLYTKHGLRGHILGSVGEHGTMKCLFHAPIFQHDTVCLALYKRVYPKYALPPSIRDDGDDFQRQLHGTASVARSSKRDARFSLVVR